MHHTHPHQAKKALRAEALARRRAAHGDGAAEAAASVRRLFMDRMPPTPGAVIAGYWPIGDELDLRPLLAALAATGAQVALPVVVERRAPLDFRLWRADDALEPGAHGTWHPPLSAPAVVPTLLLVPLLAFDDDGWRLGYGGGYYDRTLAALKPGIIAVGVGYAAQRVEKLPHDERDQRLDWILTEASLHQVSA